MSIDQQLLELPNDTDNANSVKEIVINRLLVDGVITDEQALEYADKWQVIVIKRSWFKRWMQAFNKTKDGYQYKFVKFED